MRTILLTLHIIGAGVWLGANVAQLVTTRRLASGGGTDAATWMATIVHWGRVIYMPASIVLLATGIGLVLDSDFYDFSNAFVSIGFLAVVAGAAIGIAVISKGSERAAAAFASGDDATGAAEVAKFMPWAMLDSLILVVAVLAMVGKWGA